jgi:hypothetical protein
MLGVVSCSSKIQMWYFRQRTHHFHQSRAGAEPSDRPKRLQSFRLRDLSKFHPPLHIIHFPVMFLSFKLGFKPTGKKKPNGTISKLYGDCGMHFNRGASSLSWVTLVLWTRALSIWIKVSGLGVFMGLGCNFCATGWCISSQTNIETNVLSFRSQQCCMIPWILQNTIYMRFHLQLFF